MNLLDRVIDTLAKVQFDEAIQLRRELEAMRHLNPHMEGILALKLAVLQKAKKNASEAVKAMGYLDATEEAMAWFAVLNREITEVTTEAAKQ